MAELIVALDSNSADAALKWVSLTARHVSWFKVGLELFVGAGPGILAAIRAMAPGSRVFLDLKFYDIPNTAAAAAYAAALAGADMLTVHCQGGRRMCEAVMARLREFGSAAPLTLGVTALTSMGVGDMPGITETPSQYGRELAAMAAAWGLNGVVCSGHEARAIRARHPELALVCPGIRPAGACRADQARVMTPYEAVNAGADYLVIGRPITTAPDPAQMVQEILQEMRMANNG